MMSTVNDDSPFDDDGTAHGFDTMSGTREFITARDEHGLRRQQQQQSGAGSGGGGHVETQITATQKMLAACSGSLLTSLLGECFLLFSFLFFLFFFGGGVRLLYIYALDIRLADTRGPQ